VDIIVDVETTDSLEDIAQAINEAAQEWAGDNDSGVPLSAKILDNTLVLTSGTTGTAAAMTFSDDDGVLESLGVVETVEGSKDFADELQSATDAQIKLDGLTVTRPDNTIDDVLDGVTIELNGIGAAKVDVTLDAETAVNSISSMVDAYNATLDWINIRVAEATVDDAESDT
jgi:flagellar hook-associated protein 2